jgi:5'-nucleotidase
MRLASLVLAALALSSCVEAAPPLAPAAPPVAAPRCLSVVAWNDLHGQLGADDPIIDTGRLAAGGVVALADTLTALRATGDAVVVVEAGDLFTGPLASTLAEGAPVIEAYNLLGVDAATLGNHDFDFGPVGSDKVTAPAGVGDEAGAVGPRGALLARLGEARFPFLSANVHRKGGAATGWAGHRASTIVERGGFKVGVVGYTTRDTPTTTLRPNVDDLDFATGAAASVAREIRALRAAGAAPVVLTAHASIEGELPTSLADARPHTGEMARLAAELGPDVPDVIVAGHRHAWMIGRVSGVPIVSSDQHGVGLARIRFCPAGPAQKLDLEAIERHVNPATTPPLSELGVKVAAAMAPWEERVKAIADAPVATIATACEPKAPGGTALADQVARAAAENIAAAAKPPAGVPVVGLTNIGSLRAPIVAGQARFRDMFTVIPFENTVAACGTTRAGLVRFLQNGLGKDSSRERFPFGVSGARIRVKRGADGRLALVGVEVEGLARDAKDDATVWLAISDFILWGGDDLLAGVPCAPAVTSQTRVRDAWTRVLGREKACDGPSRNVVME